MSAGCEWCQEHRESLVRISDQVNDLRRGASALVTIALTDGIDGTDANRFIAEQIFEIADSADLAFDGMTLPRLPIMPAGREAGS